MKIYIAGKVTGEDRKETLEKFKKFQDILTDAGHQPVNPMDHVSEHDNWNVAMKKCIKMLVECDGVFLIHDWKESNGARLEFECAHAFGLHMFTEHCEGYLRMLGERVMG